MIFRRHKQLLHNNDLRALGDSIVNTVPGGKGLPLGVEPSQAEMIAFPSALDNYIKCQLSIQCAGHYMDDYYVIVPPDRDPKEIMNLVVAKAESLRLTISRSKSRIVPLTKPFRYCKAKYRLTETGKVIVNGNRDGVKRARRKIKAFYKKIKTVRCPMRICGHRSMVCWLTLNRITTTIEFCGLEGCSMQYSGSLPNELKTSEKEESKVKYIVHKRFKDKAICGDVNLPALTECESHDGFITCGVRLSVARPVRMRINSFLEMMMVWAWFAVFSHKLFKKLYPNGIRIIRSDGIEFGTMRSAKSIGVPTMKISGCGTIISLMPTLMTCGISLN